MKVIKPFIVMMHYKLKNAFINAARKRYYTAAELICAFIEKFLEDPEKVAKFLYGEKENDKTNNRRNKGIL